MDTKLGPKLRDVLFLSIPKDSADGAENERDEQLVSDGECDARHVPVKRSALVEIGRVPKRGTSREHHGREQADHPGCAGVGEGAKPGRQDLVAETADLGPREVSQEFTLIPCESEGARR